jgi:hypothetical protein
MKKTHNERLQAKISANKLNGLAILYQKRFAGKKEP